MTLGFFFFFEAPQTDLKWITLMVDEMLSEFLNVVSINILVTIHSKKI